MSPAIELLEECEKLDLDVERFSKVRAGDVRWRVMKHVGAGLSGNCYGCLIGEGATLAQALAALREAGLHQTIERKKA